ncbi:unnamed protein product [Symbiodinium sp. CCMP2592]|nr:unnamed protein product [Symbiodinium sp. CCMP2592]
MKGTVCLPCLDYRRPESSKPYIPWFNSDFRRCSWFTQLPARCASFGLTTYSGRPLEATANEACCACGGGTQECLAKYEAEIPLEGTDFKVVTVTGSTDFDIDEKCCEACRSENACQYWFRDLGTGSVSCTLGHSATLRRRWNGVNSRGGYRECKWKTGFQTNGDAYPCSCGSATCTKGQKCYADANLCEGPYLTLDAYAWDVQTACTAPDRGMRSREECESARQALGIGYGVGDQLRSAGGPAINVLSAAIASASSNALSTGATNFFFQPGAAFYPLVSTKNPQWPGTCIQTNVEAGSWYKVDFRGKRYRFTSVQLLSRNDCCEDELKNVDILVGNAGSSSFTTCATAVSVFGRGVPTTFACRATGSIIQIQHRGTKALSLCGFSAFGIPTTSLAEAVPAEIGLVSDLILAANISNGSESTSSEAPDEAPAQTVDTVIISGHCELGVDGIYVSSGATSSGASFYTNDDGYFLYFDPDCDGLGTQAKWLIGTDLPNTTRSSDLDDDGACEFVAAIASASTDPAGPPTGELSWRMRCEESFSDGSLRLEIGDSQFWQNNFGESCASYVSKGWCNDGGFAAGFEWTGKEQYLDQSTVPQACQKSSSFQQDGNCAEFYNFPGRNCAACGKGAKAANCSIADGSASSVSYPCLCGNATCTSGQVCTSSSSTCQDSQSGPTLITGVVSMVLANCSEIIAEPNASYAIAEGVGKHFRLPTSWISVELTCGLVLLQGKMVKEGREDSLQAEYLISIPQANLSVYDPATIAGNVQNADSVDLAVGISTSLAGNQIVSDSVEVTGTSAEEVPEPEPSTTEEPSGPSTTEEPSGPSTTEEPSGPSGPRVSCKTLFVKCRSWMLRRQAACKDFNLYCKGNRAGKGYYSYSYTR